MKNKCTQQLTAEKQATDEQTSPEVLEKLARNSTELARLVAKNPGTPPELLLQLGDHEDPMTREHVAANPNTPKNMLLELGAQFPEQVLNNSVLPLLLLENPHLVDEMPLTSLRSILKQEKVPVYFLERAANHSDREVLEAVAMNAQTPRTILEKLVLTPYRSVAQAARLHVNWAGTLDHGWDEAARQEIGNTLLDQKDWMYLKKLAEVGFLSEFVLDSLRKNYTALQEVASNPKTHHQILEKLAGDKDWQIRLAIAANPSTNVKILEQFAQDDNWWLRWEVAKNPNTPQKVLECLAKNPSDRPEVLLAVALHPQTSILALEQLINHPYSQVAQTARQRLNPVKGERTQAFVELQSLGERDNLSLSGEMSGNQTHFPSIQPLNLVKTTQADDRIELTEIGLISQLILDGLKADDKTLQEFAEHPNTPTRILERLAKENSPQIRKALASNLKTPVYILEQLARDSSPEILKNIAANPNTPSYMLEQLARTYDLQVLVAVASNPNTPGRILERLAETDNKLQILLAVASNPSTPFRLLEHLAKDEMLGICLEVARNPNAPDEILAELARDYLPQLRLAVAQNSNTPATILEQLATDKDFWVRHAVAKHPNTPGILLQQLANSKNVEIRKTVAKHPSTPRTILKQLAKDNDFQTRLAVAQNPNTPVPILEYLAKDENLQVLREVAQHQETTAEILKQLASNDHLDICLRESEWTKLHEGGLPESPLAQDQSSLQDERFVVPPVAGHLNTPGSILEQLAKNNRLQFCQAIVFNPNIDLNLIQQLIKEQNIESRKAIAKDQNTPVNVLEQLLFDESNSVAQLAGLSLDRNPENLSVVVENYTQKTTPLFTRVLLWLDPDMPTDVPLENYCSTNWLERYVIAQNPNTPPDILQVLVQDGNRIVRAAAEANVSYSF